MTAEQTPCPPPRQIHTPSSSLSLRQSRAVRQVQFSSPVYHPHSESESYVRHGPESPERVEGESGALEDDEERGGGEKTPVPVAARRDFFLSVVNSTVRLGARPRLSGGGWGNTTSVVAPTPRTIADTTINANATRRRYSLNPSTPHGGLGDTSTTNSSHDLTHAARVNASFDARPARFNASKLNTYLHALNRRLVEENEELTAQLNALRAGGGDVSGISNNRNNNSTMVLEVEELRSTLEALEREREMDKERWKGRMREVEEGVGALVKELEDRAADAERRAMAASQRARRAEQADHEQADGPLREELHRADEESTRLRDENARLKTRLATVDATKASVQAHAGQLEEQLQKAQSQIAELEDALAGAEGAAEELASTQVELDGALEDVDTLKGRVVELEARAEGAEESVAGLTRALEDAETRIVQGQEELGALKARTRELERRNRSAEASFGQSQSGGAGGLTTITEEKSTFVSAASQAHIQELEVLERELDTAHREIARLNHLLSSSPTRMALQQAKDARIAMLEREKEEVDERVRTLKVMLGASGASALPGGISPPVNRTLAMLKTPKTPGGPLREVSAVVLLSWWGCSSVMNH
jgi:DNA repair exonuclease SbcCD ATPase subunit